nr:uncharacterized mitochondrial protein AtMg00810-like [Tanacetum cinerariifolium]
MNYHPVLAENQTNSNAGFQDTEKAGEEGTQTYKSVSPDIHSSSCGDQTRKQGNKAENMDKGKSPVVTITGFRDLNEEFEECINNSSNGVNAAGSSVSAAGLNFTNSTNDFSVASPLNAAMPNLEDLSHNADDVGVEADINNMESTISVKVWPKEPKRVHQALKDLSWIEAMQEELLQFKMQKFWILVDLPYGKRVIEEEVYVCQPPGKALYGVHQAPRAWYETLATYLLENRFQRGTIDQTLFIKKKQKDILLVQIYVNDIIFGATNKALCQSFEKLMKDKFRMRSMGELTFFLGLHVKQKKDGIFICQDKYAAKILRKFRLSERKSASTPIDVEKPLLKDLDGEDVDVHTYRLISWQCKKQIVVATSSTEAEYVAAASGCAQVLWMQNQLLNYSVLIILEDPDQSFQLVVSERRLLSVLIILEDPDQSFQLVVSEWVRSFDQEKNNIQAHQKKKMIKTSSSLKNEACCSKDSLAQVESRLVEYKEREIKYIEKIRTLEFYDEGKVEYIETLKKEVEILKQEKEVVDGKLAGLLSASKNLDNLIECQRSDKSKEEILKQEKEVVNGKLAGLLSASKILDNLIESQRLDKSKEGLGYTAVPPPIAQLYISPKKDLSWTGLSECADDTITYYSRPSPTVESTSKYGQNRNSSASENGEPTDSILSKPAVKFMKVAGRSTTNKVEVVKKPSVKYA